MLHLFANVFGLNLLIKKYWELVTSSKLCQDVKTSSLYHISCSAERMFKFKKLKIQNWYFYQIMLVFICMWYNIYTYLSIYQSLSLSLSLSLYIYIYIYWKREPLCCPWLWSANLYCPIGIMIREFANDPKDQSLISGWFILKTQK